MLNVFFQKFGLTSNEKSIYIFLLSHGEEIASVIGKRLKIKRVTVYASLESLSKKKLITSYQKNKVTFFEAVSPEEIITLCKEETSKALQLQREAESILSELKRIEETQTRPILEVKGKIQYYQGIDAVKKLITETLEEGASEQLCFGLNTHHTQNLEEDWKQYTKKRVAANMNVRSIQPDTKAAKEYKSRDKNELRATRLVPHETFPGGCELNIIGDMIALFSAHGNKPTGAKIYDKEMAQVLRSLFELAWERSKEYDKETTH